MATVTNKTRVTLSVSSHEFNLNIGAGKDGKVPDDVAEAWSKKDAVKPWIDAGAVLVVLSKDEKKGKSKKAGKKQGKKAGKKESKAKGATTPTNDVVEAAVDDINAINGQEDLDTLELMHANEERPEVLEAIQARMTELQE